MSEFLVIGHRGAMGHAPENTLLSVRKALEMGVDGVEIDVHLAGGELVIFHDDDLKRTTNGRGRLDEHSLDYLRSLDAGEGERIPLLREVIDFVDGRALLNVELKGKGTAAPVAAMLAKGVAAKGWKPESFLVSSFDPGELRTFSDANVGVRRGVLASKRHFREALPLARELKAYSVNLELAIATEDVVAEAHREGFAVFVYTVNSATIARELEMFDVGGVFTDYPDRIFKRHEGA